MSDKLAFTVFKTVLQNVCQFCATDNIDTRGALDSIRDCITACNLYLRGGELNCLLLRDIAAYITRMMRVFGAIHSADEIGFPLSSAGSTNVSSLTETPFNINKIWYLDKNNNPSTLLL